MVFPPRYNTHFGRQTDEIQGPQSGRRLSGVRASFGRGPRISSVYRLAHVIVCPAVPNWLHMHMGASIGDRYRGTVTRFLGVWR